MEAANVDDARVPSTLSVLIMFATGCRKDVSPGEGSVPAQSRCLFHPRCADALAENVVRDRLRSFPRETLNVLDA